MKRMTQFLTLLLTLIAVPLLAQTQDHIVDSSKNPKYLVVLSGKSSSLKGNKLVLRGVPNVIYFSDTPYRIAGHIPLQKFVSNWDKGTNGKEGHTPNATLSILDAQNPKNIPVELAAPQVKGDTLVYTVYFLDQQQSGTFGPTTLFIDPVSPQITE